MLDRLAEIKVPLMERYEQWLENRPVQFRSAPESVSHLRSPKIAGLAKHPLNVRDAMLIPARSPSTLKENDWSERHKQVVAPVSPVSSIESSPSSDPPDVSNVPFTEVGEISSSFQSTYRLSP
jgi:hypothetical protein